MGHHGGVEGLVQRRGTDQQGVGCQTLGPAPGKQHVGQGGEDLATVTGGQGGRQEPGVTAGASMQVL